MTRRTAITDKNQWRQRLQAGLPRIKAVFDKHGGFDGVEYFWGAANDGSMAEVTRWRSRADFEAALKDGALATAATYLDAFVPTAAYPNGNWVRQDFEQVA